MTHSPRLSSALLKTSQRVRWGVVTRRSARSSKAKKRRLDAAWTLVLRSNHHRANKQVSLMVNLSLGELKLKHRTTSRVLSSLPECERELSFAVSDEERAVSARYLFK